MPTVRSWRQARGLITELLQTPAQMDQLQHDCSTWWRGYKQQYTAELGAFLAARAAAPADDSTPVMLPHYRKAGWQVRELLRHHDARAFARRVRTQATRMLKGSGSRVAYRPGTPAS